MHPRLTGGEHLLEVVPQELPFVEVVLTAVLAGDHHPLDALCLEDAAHRLQVHEVGLDVLALLLRQLVGLVDGLVIGRACLEGLVARGEVVVRHAVSSSSSTKRNVLNASA